jgi:filamentous hemagglutinin
VSLFLSALAVLPITLGTDAYKSTMAAYGTGSDLQRAAQAVTAAVQGLAGGNLAQAVVGASAPYLAGIIKDNTGDNLEARIMAHAVLGAVLAKSQQNSALAGATGASIGELVAYELYPNKPIDQLSEAEKQKVSALSTLAGGLAAGIVAGNSSDAVAGGIAAKNAVENNQLRGSEGITLAQEQAEYKKRNCGGTSSSRCDELSKNIKELLARDSSVLKDMPAVEGDIGTDPGSRPQPGQLVSCALSGNGVCVVSDRTVKTDLGDEWALEPASDAQSITHKAEVATTVAAQKAYLDEFSKETFAAGCGGMGLAGIACQTYMASGGKNPITGEVATTTERFGFGLQAVLNSAGLFGAVYDGAAASIDLAPVKGAKGTSTAPAWDNAVSKADGDFGYLPPLRQNYVREVYDLQTSVDNLRAGGASAEDIAKYAYSARNDLKLKYREYTPPDMLETIDARNMERYGNKIGPAFDDLVKKGKTFEQIIESSTRAGGGDIF